MSIYTGLFIFLIAIASVLGLLALFKLPPFGKDGSGSGAKSGDDSCTSMCKYAGAWAGSDYTPECNKGSGYASATGDCEDICTANGHSIGTQDIPGPCLVGCRCGKHAK